MIYEHRVGRKKVKMSKVDESVVHSQIAASHENSIDGNDRDTYRRKGNDVGRRNHKEMIFTNKTKLRTPTPLTRRSYGRDNDAVSHSTSIATSTNYQNNGQNSSQQPQHNNKNNKQQQQRSNVLSLSPPDSLMSSGASSGSNSSNSWNSSGISFYSCSAENERGISGSSSSSSSAGTSSESSDSYLKSSSETSSVKKNNGSGRHHHHNQQHRNQNQQHFGAQQRNYNNTPTPKHAGRGGNNYNQQNLSNSYRQQNYSGGKSGRYMSSPSVQQNQRRNSLVYSPQERHQAFVSPLLTSSSRINVLNNSGASSVMTPSRSPVFQMTPDGGMKGGVAGAGITTGASYSGAGSKLRTGATLKHSSPLMMLGNNGKISPLYQQMVPTALTHFANSKCFDSPAPNTLPKPPDHWKTSRDSTKSTTTNNEQKRRRRVTGGTDSQESEDVEKELREEETVETIGNDANNQKSIYQRRHHQEDHKIFFEELKSKYDHHHSKELLEQMFARAKRGKINEGVGESASVKQEVGGGWGFLRHGGLPMRSSKRNLLDDFETYNLKLLLKVQS